MPKEDYTYVLGRIADIPVTDAVSMETAEKAVSGLPAWRRGKAMGFRQAADRYLSAESYRLLCSCLKDILGKEVTPTFSYSEHGKPFLKDFPGLKFSLSHCRRSVACIVSDREVGIDTEEIREYDDSLAAFVLSDEELSKVRAASSPSAEFTRLWTMKESYAKMTGRGLGNDLKNILKEADASFETITNEEGGYIVTSCTKYR